MHVIVQTEPKETQLRSDLNFDSFCSVPRWLRAGMAIGRRAQNARNIRAKRVNYRTLINAIARSQYLTVWHMHAPCAL